MLLASMLAMIWSLRVIVQEAFAGANARGYEGGGAGRGALLQTRAAADGPASVKKQAKASTSTGSAVLLVACFGFALFVSAFACALAASYEQPPPLARFIDSRLAPGRSILGARGRPVAR